MEPLKIQCDKHGDGVAASLCGHLVRNFGSSIGFIENSSDINDLQAWCGQCESLFIKENEITEKFKEFHDLTIVCVECYKEIKEKHETNT